MSSSDEGDSDLSLTVTKTVRHGPMTGASVAAASSDQLMQFEALEAAGWGLGAVENQPRFTQRQGKVNIGPLLV